MQERRVSTVLFHALEEDIGIFKRGVVEMKLDVTPLRKFTTRGDLLCVGFLDDTEIEIIFPGRRRLVTKPLEMALERLVSSASKAALSANRPLPMPIHLRFPLRARGCWRTRLVDVDEDEVARRYQFLAAHWTIRDGAGLEQTYGEMPLTK